jgi:tetratricopeptide (TPR) repeat protein
MRDLDEAIQIFRQAVQGARQDNPDLSEMSNHLADALERRYKSTGQLEDLEEAVQVTPQAIQILPSQRSLPRYITRFIKQPRYQAPISIRWKRTEKRHRKGDEINSPSGSGHTR